MKKILHNYNPKSHPRPEVELKFTETEMAWLAGLLEGEGSFHFTMTGKTPGLRIQLAMTDRDVVERVAKMFSTTITTIPLGNIPNGLGSVKDYHRTYICGAKARAVMVAIRPFMGQRRTKEIDKQLTAWETRSTLKSRVKTKSPLAIAAKAYLLMEAFEFHFPELADE